MFLLLMVKNGSLQDQSKHSMFPRNGSFNSNRNIPCFQDLAFSSPTPSRYSCHVSPHDVVRHCLHPGIHHQLIARFLLCHIFHAQAHSVSFTCALPWDHFRHRGFESFCFRRPIFKNLIVNDCEMPTSMFRYFIPPSSRHC